MQWHKTMVTYLIWDKSNVNEKVAWERLLQHIKIAWPWKKPSWMRHLWGTNVVLLVVEIGLLCDENAQIFS